MNSHARRRETLGAPTDPTASDFAASGEQSRQIRLLDEEECWQLLSRSAIGRSTIGRFAIHIDDEIDIYPVNFLVHEHRVYFRSAPGSKLAHLRDAGKIAFESDGTIGEDQWSVVIRGSAERIYDDGVIITSGVLALETLAPGDKFNYVEIIPSTITGRSFRPDRP